MIEYLTKNQVKTRNRLETAKKTVSILELFFEIGHRTKQDVFTQLTIYFPKYNTTIFKKQFTDFWNFRTFNQEIVKDLESALDNMNAL